MASPTPSQKASNQSTTWLLGLGVGRSKVPARSREESAVKLRGGKDGLGESKKADELEYIFAITVSIIFNELTINRRRAGREG